MSKRIERAGLSLAFSALLALAPWASASAETLLQYQGRLKDAEARPVPDGPYDFLFALYAAPEGGKPVWHEWHGAVIVHEGHYAVALGSDSPLELPEGRYWLETAIEGEALSPRTELDLSTRADCTIDGNLAVTGVTTLTGALDAGGGIALDGGTAASGAIDFGAGADDNLTAADVMDLTDAGDTTLHAHDGRYYTETELGSTGATSGASQLGVNDAGGLFTATSVEDALQEVGTTAGTLQNVFTIVDGPDANDPVADAAMDTLRLLAGDGISISGDSSTDSLTFAVTGMWRLGGNAGTAAGTDFLGTTDNQPLELKVNGARALRLEPSSIPNLIGGSVVNTVTAGVKGATIAGGGDTGLANLVTDNHGTVGGGRDNQAGDANTNPMDAIHATVGGGTGNTASGDSATVAGGISNTSSSDGSFVGGGLSNTASGLLAAVSGGDSNMASGATATVAGGTGNTASGSGSFVGGGSSNTASGTSAAVSGGVSNTASASFSAIPGGNFTVASLFGQMAHAAGRFNTTSGSAQTSVFVLRHETAGITLEELFLDGASARLSIATGRTTSFEVLLVARTSAGESAGYRAQGLIENVGGTTAFVGAAPTFTVIGEDDGAWNATLSADDTNDALVISVLGNGGDTVRWVATVRTSEVAF